MDTLDFKCSNCSQYTFNPSDINQSNHNDSEFKNESEMMNGNNSDENEKEETKNNYIENEIISSNNIFTNV